jgi:hypothetical protein
MIIILLVINCILCRREKIGKNHTVVDDGVDGGGGEMGGVLLLYTSSEIVYGPSDTEFLQPLDLAFTLIYKLLRHRNRLGSRTPG